MLLTSSLWAAAVQAGSLSVLSHNMERLFDDIDDGNEERVLSAAEFSLRAGRAAARFADEFSLPRIIALQEIENRNTLDRIAARLSSEYGARYRSVSIPGNDPSGINLGFLIDASVEIRRSGQLFRETTAPAADHALFSRPPLYVEACYLGECLTLVNLHLRSMRGINGRNSERVRRKRLLQAETVAAWCQEFQLSNPRERLAVLGDFNALTPPDSHVDVAGILRGKPDNRATVLRGRDLLEPDLVDLTESVPGHERHSYRFRGRMQQLDYLLVNSALAGRLEEIRFSDIDYGVSDHAGLWASFDW